MRTSTINYRVADFLRRFSPFDLLQETQLMDLASQGRVKMHQRGERLFWEGAEPGPYIFVIQQGTVRLVTGTDEAEALHDMLGPGDMIGIDRLLGHDVYRHTGCAATDVVVYALRTEDLERIVAAHRDVARYLASTTSVRETETDAEPLHRGLRSWVDDTGPTASLASSRLLTCSVDTTIRASASRMRAADSDALVVVDADGSPLGLVTTTDLRDEVATAQVSPDARVDAIMRDLTAIAPPGGRVGDYLLSMIRTGESFVALTADGTQGTPIEGLVTSADILVRHGAHLAGLARELRRAPSFTALAALHGQIRSLTIEELIAPAALAWLVPAVSELQRALVGRVVELATEQCAATGVMRLELDTDCLLFGAAARGELLTAHDLDCGLVYADPPAAKATAAREQMATLGQHVAAGLRAAGWVFSPTTRVMSDPHWCQPLSTWQARYAAWVRDPVGTEIYRARALFDLRGLASVSPLVDDLRRQIVTGLEQSEAFVPVLANDTLAEQPPLTFFEGLVVGDDGTRTAHFDMVRSALQPLTDVGRVFALAARTLDTTSTSERLELAGRRDPTCRELLDEAAEAFRIALFHRARTGLREGHDGTLVDPTRLTRYEQTVLKSVFRAVASLLTLTDQRFLGRHE